MSNWVLATCTCCKISQKVRYRADDPTKDPMCDPCAGHRGADVEKRIKRAEDHAAVWQERGAQAMSKASEYENRMKQAYRSRDVAVGMLRRLYDIHEPNRRGCSCGAKDCRSVRILESPWLRDMMRRLAIRELDQRHRDGWWDDFDADEKLVETVYLATQRRDSGMAG